MRLFGHPVHPMLIGLPLGLLSSTPLWDWLARALSSRPLAAVAHYDALLGLVAALVAAIPGALDLAKLDRERVAIGLRHAGIMIVSLSLFGVAFALRQRGELPSLSVCALDSLAALTLSVGGWFGGELVFGHGVGVLRRAQTTERGSGASGQSG